MKISVEIKTNNGRLVSSIPLEVWKELLEKYLIEYNDVEKAVEALIKDIKMSISTK